MKTRLNHDFYVQCPACGMIISDPKLSLTEKNKPAPCCGAFGQSRCIWPSFTVQKFLEIVDKQDLNSNEERPIAIVFLCSALELLLEQALWSLLDIHTKSEQLAQLILDSNRERDRRIKLYNKLSDCPLGDLLQSRNMATFLDEWDHLSELRNEVVHGRYYTGGEQETELIRNVYRNCLKTFAEVHNDVQRMIRMHAIKAEEIAYEGKEGKF
jgi:hypothetical protein